MSPGHSCSLGSCNLESDIDALYDLFDTLLYLGKFDILNKVIEINIPFIGKCIEYDLAILTASGWEREKLTARAEFYKLVAEWCEEEYGTRAGCILYGLE